MTGMGPYYEEILVEYFCLFCIVTENSLFPSNDSPMILLGLIFFPKYFIFFNSSFFLVFLVVKFLTDNFSYVCHWYLTCHRLTTMGKRKVFARLFVLLYFSSLRLYLKKDSSRSNFTTGFWNLVKSFTVMDFFLIYIFISDFSKKFIFLNCRPGVNSLYIEQI